MGGKAGLKLQGKTGSEWDFGRANWVWCLTQECSDAVSVTERGIPTRKKGVSDEKENNCSSKRDCLSGSL